MPASRCRPTRSPSLTVRPQAKTGVAADAQIAYVALGSNLQDPIAQVRAGFEALERLPATRVTRRSSLYRTAPVGKLDQPDFANAVACLETGLDPQTLLRGLLDIEAQHARVRGERNAPRTLDLDLLLYGEQRIDTPGLTLPHPRMHERAFVLVPLLEVAPDAVVPGRGAVHELLAALPAQRVARQDA
jgi:2-amino-4-hydroxy-6-hydroxymethyldihydropteridine diphosphokinase